MRRVFFILLMMLICAQCAFCENERWSNPKNIKTYIQHNHRNTVMMQHAFQRWTKVTNRKLVFALNSNQKSADIEVIFVEKIGERSANDKAIGLTKSIYTLDGKMIHSTIWIANKTIDNRALSKDEIFTTMLHEIGHAIGLKHSQDKESVMCPTVDVVQEISKEDIQKIYNLYK